MFNTLPKLWENFDKFSLGYEDTFQRLADFGSSVQKSISSNYPPFNILKNKEGSYTLELAVAGFGKQDLDINMSGGVLTVAGHTKSESGNGSDNFLYKGIAERSFERSFTLADTVKIKNAELLNGMLKIYLDNVVAAKEALKIPIHDGSPELLNEEVVKTKGRNDPK